jgi:hypothetical protein
VHPSLSTASSYTEREATLRPAHFDACSQPHLLLMPTETLWQPQPSQLSWKGACYDTTLRPQSQLQDSQGVGQDADPHVHIGPIGRPEQHFQPLRQLSSPQRMTIGTTVPKDTKRGGEDT